MDEATVNQGMPVRGTGPAIVNLVLDDIRHYPDTLKSDFIRRSSQGELKYTYPLQANNGRDALADLYQELLDAVLYAKQLLEEVDKPFIYGDPYKLYTTKDLYNDLLDQCDFLHGMIQERKEKKCGDY